MSKITYVTFAAGGGQYRVKTGDTILLNRLPTAEGETVKLDNVLLAECADGSIKVGAEAKNISVTATVSEQALGEKLRIFKMRRRKSSRRTNGHRQQLTRLLIGDIQGA